MEINRGQGRFKLLMQQFSEDLIQNNNSECKEEINRYQERWEPDIDLEKFENINKDIKNPNI